MLASLLISVSLMLPSITSGPGLQVEPVKCVQVQCVTAPCPPVCDDKKPVRKTCKKGFVAMPDERREGAIICMSNREKKKAQKICAANGSSDWRECTCQDGGKVAACGD